ncbi:MAG: glutamate formimidoyltransferase [Armatimonadetes bacterium]|nr:glutamate formimidoyltransferase [Armatimonadota bacterium]
MKRIVESIPNFSEGRDPDVLEALRRAFRSVEGVALADDSADPDHHRSVYTILGEPEAVLEALCKAVRVGVERIDLNHHQGSHPRIGAVDVIPFVPLQGVGLEECVALAHRLGEWMGGELQVPVYYYEEAALVPERRNLADVRRGGFEAIRDNMLADVRQPDAGPGRAHPSAGAACIGARGPLIAFNINLTTNNPEIARAIATRVREKGGGLKGLKAIGVDLKAKGSAQVSMNITLPRETSLYRVFELVRLEAARYGVDVAESELIGAVSQEFLLETVRYYLRCHDLKESQVLENWF